uniref:Uncharacterized protein n=1 Tax=Anguilla anguilla TaxID=7936 RepID=A0A0E9TEZ9_ANGAN
MNEGYYFAVTTY